MAQRGLEDVVQVRDRRGDQIVGAQFGAFFYNARRARRAYMLYTLSGVPREAFARFPMPRNTQCSRRHSAARASSAPTTSPQTRATAKRAAPRDAEGPSAGVQLPRGAVMSRSGEVLGGLFFGHSDLAVFDAEAERLVVGVAALAALAIENARLHDTAQRELAASRRAYLERDLVARVLQESLLPASLPQVDGLDAAAAYAPGSAVVGGDLLRPLPVGGDAHVAAIGDVQGKDARAAARTSLVRHAVRLAATHANGPIEALEVVNGATLQDADEEDPRFSTLLVARVEPHPKACGCISRAAATRRARAAQRRHGRVDRLPGHAARRRLGSGVPQPHRLARQRRRDRPLHRRADRGAPRARDPRRGARARAAAGLAGRMPAASRAASRRRRWPGSGASAPTTSRCSCCARRKGLRPRGPPAVKRVRWTITP